MTLDLYFQGNEQHRSTPFTVTLQSAPAAVLYTGAVAPKADWRAGEVICRRLRVRIPAATMPGDYRLHLATADDDQPFGQLTVQPSTRRFEVPAVTERIDATLGDAIRLHGADVAWEADALAVQFVWQ